MLLVFLGISVFMFVLGLLSPGDPAELALSRGGNYQPTDEQIHMMREVLGLNKPYFLQYIDWLKKALVFDFGISYSTGKAVGQLFLEKLPYTLKLGIVSVIITGVLGVTSGILAATNHDKFLDSLIKSFQNIVLSLPQFWIGLLLILVFNEKLKILPSSGVGSFRHLILPAVTLSLIGIGNISRFSRSSFLSELGKSYYSYGVARGISNRILFFKHLFKNAMLGVLPLIGNYVGGLLGGSSVVELIFAVPGIGAFAVESILLKDIPFIQAYVLFSSGIFLVTYTFVDIISGLLNPKLKGELDDK